MVKYLKFINLTKSLWFDFVINATEVKFSVVGKLKCNKDEEKLLNNLLSGAHCNVLVDVM